MQEPFKESVPKKGNCKTILDSQFIIHLKLGGQHSDQEGQLVHYFCPVLRLCQFCQRSVPAFSPALETLMRAIQMGVLVCQHRNRLSKHRTCSPRWASDCGANKSYCDFINHCSIWFCLPSHTHTVPWSPTQWRWVSVSPMKRFSMSTLELCTCTHHTQPLVGCSSCPHRSPCTQPPILSAPYSTALTDLTRPGGGCLFSAVNGFGDYNTGRTVIHCGTVLLTPWRLNPNVFTLGFILILL